MSWYKFESNGKSEEGSEMILISSKSRWKKSEVMEQGMLNI